MKKLSRDEAVEQILHNEFDNSGEDMSFETWTFNNKLIDELHDLNDKALADKYFNELGEKVAFSKLSTTEQLKAKLIKAGIKVTADNKVSARDLDAALVAAAPFVKDDAYFETDEYKNLEKQAKEQFERLKKIKAALDAVVTLSEDYAYWLDRNKIQVILSDQAQVPNASIIDRLEELTKLF